MLFVLADGELVYVLFREAGAIYDALQEFPSGLWLVGLTIGGVLLLLHLNKASKRDD